MIHNINMTIDEQSEFFNHVLLRIRWQRFSPRHKKKTLAVIPPSDPIFDGFRSGNISKSEICKYLDIDEKDLVRTLVDKGELF